MQPDPSAAQPAPALAIICYSKCWDCQFGHHSGKPHTWMDSEDIEFAKDVAWPETPEAWAALAQSHPCGCWCLKTPPCPACHGSGEHPDNDEHPCGQCNGRGHTETTTQEQP
jgi:hypothetical protein